MASFDVSSSVDWQEIDNAVNQALKEVSNRFDFKGAQSEIKVDQKNKTILLTCSEENKLDALVDVFQTKLVKRGVSLLSFDYEEPQAASGSSGRQLVHVQAGISKEKGKEIIKVIKSSKLKVQAQLQDEQVRVTAKSRDLLQETITFLKDEQERLKIPLSFGNYR